MFGALSLCGKNGWLTGLAGGSRPKPGIVNSEPSLYSFPSGMTIAESVKLHCYPTPFFKTSICRVKD
jgi:hypothetical protein